MTNSCRICALFKIMFKFSPETPPDSGMRANNSLTSSRKAGHVVPIPFLNLEIRVVTIVAAQSLQLGMVCVTFEENVRKCKVRIREFVVTSEWED